MHRTGWGRRRPDRCWRCVYVPERWGGRPRAGRSRSVTRGGRWSGSPWPSGRIWMVVPAAGAHRAPEVAQGVLKEVQRSMGEWRFENHHEIAVVAPGGFEPVFEANLAWAKSQTPMSRRSAPWVHRKYSHLTRLCTRCSSHVMPSCRFPNRPRAGAYGTPRSMRRPA